MIIDIRKPRVIHLTPEKNHLPAGSAEQAHSILLPDFGLVFPNINQIKSKNWKDCVKRGNDYELHQLQCATPEASELALLIDRTKSPCFDPQVSPRISTDDWYWTATVDPSSSDFAYVVYFLSGYVSWNFQSHGGFVLPVLRVARGQYSAFGIEG
ncbi:MAG TPA: DUF1566 domain-containing protein [Nevskiaceae bacterium]|nr:DUF1566 domain-containing protein [Nevskiaceae bacterium]